MKERAAPMMKLPAERYRLRHCPPTLVRKAMPVVFFGLSGTGKPPSTDLKRLDWHDASPANDDAFNFEGGCYAENYCCRKKRES